MSSNVDKKNHMRELAHDLRNPLNNIGGFVDILKQAGPLNEQQEMAVGKILETIDRTHTLINNVMDMAELDADSVLKAEACHMVLFVREGLALVEGAALEKQVTISTQWPDDLPTIEGESYRLKQMVNNLLGNAIKYNDEGGTVHVTLSVEDDHVVLAVQDTGLGIGESDIPHIFDEFYRGRTPGKRIRGNGLGLALVKAIIDRHHGTIAVTSVQGEGTTFTVRLPQQQPVADGDS